jgi:hypothetical protein
LENKIIEYIKLAKFAIVQEIDFVKDEHCFSTLTFMKTKLQNQLVIHLELVIRMFCQKFFTLQNFPFGAVIQNWKDNSIQYDAKSRGLSFYQLSSCFFLCMFLNTYLFLNF